MILNMGFCCQVPDGRRAGAVHTAAEPAARQHGHGAGDAAARHGPGARRRRQVWKGLSILGSVLMEVSGEMLGLCLPSALLEFSLCTCGWEATQDSVKLLF